MSDVVQPTHQALSLLPQLLQWRGRSYSERCLCMETGQAGCDCTCACDQEQMTFKAICYPTSSWWTVQPPEERQRLLAKAAICIEAYYKYED